MSAIPLRLPFGRMFNQSGSAGARRILMIGGATILGLGGIAAVFLHNRHPAPPATVIATVPSADPLPGGPHTTPVYSDLANRADQARSARAEAAHQSSVATMPGSESAVPVPHPPQVVADMPAMVTPRPAPRTAALPMAQADAPTVRPVSYHAAPAQPHPDDNQVKAYQAAIGSVLAGWGDKPQRTEIVLTPDDKRPTGAGGEDGRDDRARPRDLASTAPVPNARGIGDQAGTRVLMPAGRGVYARTVLAASSDQGGPVIVEALSGPIVGDRMTGTFQQRDTRLVVHLDSITLRDGTQHKINALVVAPDTLETSVASSVDQHYISRYVLPVAAAFVSGLGQALAQSNSTIVASPLGGATAFQHLNLSQQLGVAAGAAANQFGAAVVANAPKGPTVNMDANVDVGVVFLAPLVVGVGG